MKIILFGNTNNFPLLLTCSLRDISVDAELIVNRKELLHRPESKFPEFNNGYPDWIFDYSHLVEKNYLYKSKIITPLINHLKKADYLILNQMGPSLLPWIKRPAISFLTGSDLDYYANYNTVDLLDYDSNKSICGWVNTYLTKLLWWNFIRRQRKGIEISKAVSFFPRGVIPESDKMLDQIGVNDSKRFHIYMGDVNNIKYIPPDNNHSTVRIFCGARLTWGEPKLPGTSELDYKGIDILLYGLHKYLDEGGSPVELRLVKKGWHINETINLADKLGIRKYIIFLEEMTLSDFKKELINADICIDSLSNSAIGMTGLDAMSSGRPLIANARHDIYSSLISDTNPICHATTAEDVANHLHQLVPDYEKRKTIGHLSREFIIKHWSPAANAKICLRQLGITEYE